LGVFSFHKLGNTLALQALSHFSSFLTNFVLEFWDSLLTLLHVKLQTNKWWGGLLAGYKVKILTVLKVLGNYAVFRTVGNSCSNYNLEF